MKRPEKRDVKKSVAEIRDARARGGGRPAAAVANESRENGEMVGGDGTAPEELDQVVNILGEMDIEVEAVEETALAEEPSDKAEEPEWTEEKPEAEETERAPAETADPVRMYLQEMGGVPLLTREEEVAIAKEIEAGERDVREAVYSLDLALQYVLNLADRLRHHEIEARHIFGDDETTTESAEVVEGAEPKEDKRADAFLKQTGKLRRLATERDKLVAENEKAKTSKVRKERIAKRLETIRAAVRECLLEMQIGAKHVTMLVDKLKDT